MFCKKNQQLQLLMYLGDIQGEAKLTSLSLLSILLGPATFFSFTSVTDCSKGTCDCKQLFCVCWWAYEVVKVQTTIGLCNAHIITHEMDSG